MTISWVARLSLLVTIATTVFRMGSGSPVRLLSSTVKSEQVTSLTSAGIQSPMARLTRSPGTRYLASKLSWRPSRTQTHTGGTSFFSFSSVFSDLYS